MLYLSVHDLVRINARVCGAEQPFDYELLEEAMAAQYGYGDSTDVLGQAAACVVALAKGKPFAQGNIRTAFAAVCVYLEGNGYAVRGPNDPDRGDLCRMLLDIAEARTDGTELVETLVAGQGPVSLRQAPTVTGTEQRVMDLKLVTRVLDRESALLADLVPYDGPEPGRVFQATLHRD